MQTFSFNISSSQPIFKVVQTHLRDFFAANTALLDGIEEPELLLCLVEAIQNGRVHGGKPQDVRCELSVGPHEFIAKIRDHNPPFSLRDKLKLPDDPYAESGRGLAIIEQLVDGIALERYEDGNCLTLTKFAKDKPPRPKEEEGPLDLLYEMSESIVQAGEVNFDRIYQLVLDKAIEVFGVDRASIMNFDPERGFLKIVASRGLPDDVVLRTRVKPGEGVSGRVFQEAKPVLVETKSGREPSYKSDSFISAPMLCSPMRMGETCVGVINITERRDGRPFEARDLKLLTTLANQAASYLRIGHLIEQVKESQKLEQELLWARRIERSLLPHGACKLPEAEVYGQCEMAKHVGGDYFDYIEEGPYLYLVVADVSGHNLPAALTMVNFRSLLRSQIGLGGEPAAILRKVNAWIYKDLAVNEQQITVALIRLDREKRMISYANAGHPPVLYVKKGEREIERWKGDGILLGALPDTEYEELSRTWDSLDAMLFYTDGVVEACNRSRAPFGEKALAGLLSKYRDLTPKTLVHLLFKGLHRHMEGRTADDDLTLMYVTLK